MPKFTEQLNEDFPEVYQLYEWKRFYLDLLNCNGGDGLEPKEHSCLKAIAIDLPRVQIAKKLNIAADTVRYNLRKPYELIKMLFPDETTEVNMTERKARYLILRDYKKISQASVSSFGQKDELNYEANKTIEDIAILFEIRTGFILMQFRKIKFLVIDKELCLV